jgi:hypothetical protein
VEELMPKLTIDGLFRNGRWTRATKGVNRHELIASDEPSLSVRELGDVAVGQGLDLPIVVVRRRGRRVRRIDFTVGARRPPGAPRTRHSSALYEAVHDMAEAAVLGAASAPNVTGVVIDGKREVYLHRFLVRLLLKLIAAFLGPHIDLALPRTVLAHRPVDGVRAGLFMARGLSRGPFTWAAKADIKSFFPSVASHQVVNALRELLVVDDSLLRLITWTMTPAIHRRADNKFVKTLGAPMHQPALNALYQGSSLAPMLSNVVGHAVFDAPFAKWMSPRAILLRYVDDLLVLARNREAAEEALDLLRRLAKAAAFEMHTDVVKTTAEPIDLAIGTIAFLGYELGGGQVRLPDGAFTATLDRLRCADPSKPESWGEFVDAAASLVFDDAAALRALESACAVMSIAHGAVMTKALAHVKSKIRKDWIAKFQSYAAPVLQEYL